MSTKNFKEFIEQQSTSAKEITVDWRQELNEWKVFLNVFYGIVEGFLKPYVDSNKLSIVKDDIDLQEEYIGPYTVQTLKICLGNNKILLKPIGTNLIAAKGRVDMIGPKGQVKFVLVPKGSAGPKISIRTRVEGENPPQEEKPKPINEWSWKIATPPPRISYVELEAESFQSALMEVVNG
jgi:hypothetical protein